MQKNSKNVEKEFYSVKIEALIPAELEYKVLASSPEEALEEALKYKNKFYQAPKLNFFSMRLKVIKVFKFKSLILELIRRF